MKVLYFNHYQCKTEQRQQEIDKCLRLNQEVFDHVVIVPGRPTFSELFAMTKDYPDAINCFCNSDIYFPDTKILDKIKEGECWALCRWNLVRGKLTFFNRRDSADSFVFRGVVRDVEAHFYQGMWGTENRLIYELDKVGYAVSNPSISVKTIHLHDVDNRDHVRTPLNTVPPPYLTIEPTILK